MNDVTSLEDVTGEAAISGFKNESLGMAVLHLSHKALQTGASLQEVAKQTRCELHLFCFADACRFAWIHFRSHVIHRRLKGHELNSEFLCLLVCYCLYFSSFLHCIPHSFSRHIAKDNFLTKFRIRRVFADFVRSFQQHTVGQGRLGSQEVMYKYLSTLEHLAPRFGTETFSIFHLDLRPDGDGSGSYLNASQAHEPLEQITCSQTTHEVMVSGTTGIQWRKISAQRVWSLSLICFSIWALLSLTTVYVAGSGK